MGKKNAAKANDTGLPELMKHIEQMQDLSLRADDLIDAVLYLDNEGACDGARFAMLEIISQHLKALSNGLDCVSLPKVKL
jgi:hypothetical protein